MREGHSNSIHKKKKKDYFSELKFKFRIAEVHAGSINIVHDVPFLTWIVGSWLFNTLLFCLIYIYAVEIILHMHNSTNNFLKRNMKYSNLFCIKKINYTKITYTVYVPFTADIFLTREKVIVRRWQCSTFFSKWNVIVSKIPFPDAGLRVSFSPATSHHWGCLTRWLTV